MYEHHEEGALWMEPAPGGTRIRLEFRYESLRRALRCEGCAVRGGRPVISVVGRLAVRNLESGICNGQTSSECTQSADLPHFGWMANRLRVSCLAHCLSCAWTRPLRRTLPRTVFVHLSEFYDASIDGDCAACLISSMRSPPCPHKNPATRRAVCQRVKKL